MSKIYIARIILPNEEAEYAFIQSVRRTCYNTLYPFKLFPVKGLTTLSFSPVTILYGGNGSGKSTLLNVIAEKTRVRRNAPFNSSPFFGEYVNLCNTEQHTIPQQSEILTSDDVFSQVLDIRNLNDSINVGREELFDEWRQNLKGDPQIHSLEDYDRWHKVTEARRMTQSQYVRSHHVENVVMQSNGENSMRYFVEHIHENALYLLDEPENSLSVRYQQDLARFIEESARFYGCQFIIASHSPVILSIPEARIYNLDECPVRVTGWTELENVRRYYDFFMSRRNEFEKTVGSEKMSI